MHLRDRRTLLAFILVALFSSILAVTSPMASAEPGDPNSISGLVTRPSGTPIGGVLVSGTGPGGDTFQVVSDHTPGPGFGTYSAVGLSDGNWWVRLEELVVV